MVKVSRKLKRIFIISTCAIILAVGLVVLFISPITKYVVEKYDEQWIGRQVTMDWAYTNPFTGYVYFSNLKIHESKSDNIFFSANSVSVNIAMLKMLFNTYELSNITIDHPRGLIIQTKKTFNFTDLIEKFSTDSTDTVNSGVRFNVLEVKIKDGEFHYRDNSIPINYFIKEVNIESKGKKWDTDSVSVKFSFVSGIGNGSINGNFTSNFKNNNYSYDVVVRKFDLNILGQYLKDLTNYGTFSANLDANVKAHGNFGDQQDVSINGLIEISDFHFGKNQKDDYLSFDKFTMAMNNISPLKKIYLIDSVTIRRPYFKYELYDKSDNLETMFGKDEANVYAVAADHNRFNLIIEIARYVKVMARNFFHSYYKINRLAVYKGDLKFNDYSLNELFSSDLNPINFIADSIDKNHKRVNAILTSGIQPYGELEMAVSINPKDTGDFDMTYNFRNIPAALFNPYLISYTSFPLDRGKLELNGTWKVRQGEIQSVNHLLVIDPRVTKRIKNKNTTWLPLPLIFSFVREYGNVIDYEIPITGKLRDPEFHLQDVVFDILGNIFVKPVTTPYRMKVKNLENEIEKSLTLKWSVAQKKLGSEQEDFTNKISNFLADNPNASITVYPMQYAEKEKEYILFFEAKKKYYMSLKGNEDLSFSESDSEKVSTMSVKDSLFIKFVNKQVRDTLLFTMQDKCSRIIGPAVVDQHFKQLNAAREEAFKYFFNKRNVQSQMKIESGKNVIPYNGFSFYKIEYKGELPKSLTKAFQKLQELNDEEPRKKYEREQRDKADLTRASRK